MDDQGERTPEDLASDVQFHWSIRSDGDLFPERVDEAFPQEDACIS